MSFFQNPFFQDFRGIWSLDDRQYSPEFIVKGNPGNDSILYAWNIAPYDLSSNKILTINYSKGNVADPTDIHRLYTPLAIDVTTTAASTSAVQPSEIISALTANNTFNSYFTATTQSGILVIKPIQPTETFRFYVSNTSAESKIRFNKKAGVAELPTYFARHTIANALNYPDSNALLIQLDTGDSIDQAIITDAGLNYSVVQADWQLLRGSSGIFNFQKITVDGSNRITQIIEYPAGAEAGDLGRKIQYVYSGSNTNPDQITEIPYTIASGDLVTPS